MSKLIWLCVFVLILSMTTASIPAFAEFKFKGGASLEIKHEYWKNLFDMDSHALDNRNFFQVKTSPWGQVDFNQDTSLYVRLLNQFVAYAYYAPSASKPSGQTDKSYHFDINEVIFDNLYLELKNLWGLPLNLRLGRQDFVGQYGEGFLIFIGTPQDGTRTAYFNAAKLAWGINDKNSLDFIYINNPRDDTFLPVLSENSPPQALNTTDEEGYVLYWKNNNLNNLAFEGYYIHKREDDKGGRGLQSQKSKINTFGSFAKYAFSPWTFRGQLAYQFGDYGSNDRSALGGYGYIDRDFKNSPWSPQASLGFIYLSGDKQSSNKNEAWDPLFSRWGWISELYVKSICSDTNVSILGYWTNLQVYRTSVVLNPAVKTKLSLWYNFLRANQRVAANTVCSGSGKNRGHLLQAKIEYDFNQSASTYFLAEYLMPGNFYQDRDDSVVLLSVLRFKF